MHVPVCVLINKDEKQLTRRELGVFLPPLPPSLPALLLPPCHLRAVFPHTSHTHNGDYEGDCVFAFWNVFFIHNKETHFLREKAEGNETAEANSSFGNFRPGIYLP